VRVRVQVQQAQVKAQVWVRQVRVVRQVQVWVVASV
jgi:hypothetical protein